MDKFEKLNRETWIYNNIGNHHHHSNTGIHHPVNFDSLNRDTYCSNNKISKHDFYDRMWKKY